MFSSKFDTPDRKLHDDLELSERRLTDLKTHYEYIAKCYVHPYFVHAQKSFHPNRVYSTYAPCSQGETYNAKSLKTIDECLATLDTLLVNRIIKQHEVGEKKEEQVLSHIDAKVEVKFDGQIEDSKMVSQ